MPRAGRLLLTSPFQDFKMAVDDCLEDWQAIPWAVMLAQPLQNAEIAILSSCTADSWTPFTAVLVGILRNCQVASSSGSLTHP